MPHAAVRGIQALAVGVVLYTALSWWWAWDESAPVVNVAWALGIGCGLLAAAVAIWGLARMRVPAWGLRFDGDHWHWWPTPVRGRVHEGGGNSPGQGGSGHLRVSLACGPWCLLRAQAAPGQGQSAWIWLRPLALRFPHDAAGTASLQVQHQNAARLRTLLNWP
ncbi:MAG: hypothetical protein ACKOB5_06215 [Betaproteobacteria bacterium]